jgi:hypothetical protein
MEEDGEGESARNTSITAHTKKKRLVMQLLSTGPRIAMLSYYHTTTTILLTLPFKKTKRVTTHPTRKQAHTHHF